MDDVTCNACGKCCKKHWLLRLSGKHEMKLFEGQIVFGDFIWTNECKYLVDNKCNIHEYSPTKCKEYFCEGNTI